MNRLRKRVLVTISMPIGCICIALFYFIKKANEIFKAELEKSLGNDFHDERTVLNREASILTA